MEAPAFGRTVFVDFMPDLKPGYNLIWLLRDSRMAVLSSLRAQRSNPFFLYVARWIASLRSQ
jgi:hypothetical protein